MADDTFEYITTDYLVSIDSEAQSEKPIEYIIELGQTGVPGVKGDKGDTGYSPTITYTEDGDGIQFNLINETETYTTPTVPLMNYVETSLDNKLNVNGSNASDILTFNRIRLLSNQSNRATISTRYIDDTDKMKLIISGSPLELNGEAFASNARPNKITISKYGNDITLGNTNEANIIIDNNSARYNGYEIATKNDLENISIDTSKVVTIDTPQTITGSKTFDRANIILGNRSSIMSGSSDGVRIQPNDIGGFNIGNLSVYANGAVVYTHPDSSYGTEIATLYDISNATITLTQGGVTKGTFTLNQTGNTTINLDTGGGDISNKLDIDGSNADSNFTVNGNVLSNFGIVTNRVTIGTVEHGLILGYNSISPNTSGNATVELKNYSTSTFQRDASISVDAGGNIYLNTTSPYVANYNNNEIATVNQIPTVMTGTDGSADGISGLVPAPLITDSGKYLRADGTWATPAGGGTGGTLNYNELINKPSINNVELSGDKTLAQLGIQPAGNYALISDIPDVSNFVTNSNLANTLDNYVLANDLGSAAYTASTDYATAAQGALADTALQPGDDISSLVNDAGYLTVHQSLADYQTINTNQTITASKTLQDNVGFLDSNAGNILRPNSNDIRLGNTAKPIYIYGNSTRPTYFANGDANGKQLALLSDVQASQGATINDSQASATTTYSSNKIESLIPSLTGYATESWVQDQGYLTQHQDLSNYVTNTSLSNTLSNYALSADIPDVSDFLTSTQISNTYLSKQDASNTYTTITDLNSKQDELVSGANIKTINNQSILGSGNINIQSGSTYTAGTGIDITNEVISINSTVVALKTDIPSIEEYTATEVKTLWDSAGGDKTNGITYDSVNNTFTFKAEYLNDLTNSTSRFTNDITVSPQTPYSDENISIELEHLYLPSSLYYMRGTPAYIGSWGNIEIAYITGQGNGMTGLVINDISITYPSKWS